MARPRGYSARRLDGIAMATLAVHHDALPDPDRLYEFGIEVADAQAILRSLSDEPLSACGYTVGGWMAAIRLKVLYRDESVTNYKVHREFGMWRCDDPDGGSEHGDRLAYVTLAPTLHALFRVKFLPA